MNKIAIIANPYCGGKKGKKAIPHIESKLLEMGIKYDLFVTEYHEHGVSIVKDLNLKNYDGIFSAGGDGTNYEVLNGLLKHHKRDDIPPIGIIPVGSGNSFARDLNIFSTDDGISTLKRKLLKAVDVCSFTTGGEEYFFINLTGLGFVTDAAKTASSFKIFGQFSYVIGVLHRIIALKFHHMELEVDGKVYSEENCFVEFCNSRFTGGDMMMAPDAEIDDGYFDVIILSKTGRLKLLKTFPKIFKGTHMEIPEARCIKGKSAKIKTIPEKNLLPDGELFGNTPTEIKIYPGHVRYFT
ncbi:diacylglycerol/lipid kinase family protein [Spirochaetota bacterium]